VNVAQQDRIAEREHTCPRCGAEPGKSCWEKARGNPQRKTYLARPHAERAELVEEEHGLTLVSSRGRAGAQGARRLNPGRLTAAPQVPLALSQRIGHADVALTMKQYVQADLDADRQVAATLAELIIGGSLTSAIARTAPATGADAMMPDGTGVSLADPLANYMREAPPMIGRGP
jgi:hypothetical protein